MLDQREGGAVTVSEISVYDLKARLDRGERPVLVDIREPWEWGLYNLSKYGARHIPMGQLLDRLDELDRAAEIVVYCRSGGRSEKVQKYLRCLGYGRASHLAGGILAWGEAFDPSVPRY